MIVAFLPGDLSSISRRSTTKFPLVTSITCGLENMKFDAHIYYLEQCILPKQINCTDHFSILFLSWQRTSVHLSWDDKTFIEFHLSLWIGTDILIPISQNINCHSLSVHNKTSCLLKVISQNTILQRDDPIKIKIELVQQTWGSCIFSLTIHFLLFLNDIYMKLNSWSTQFFSVSMPSTSR